MFKPNKTKYIFLAFSIILACVFLSGSVFAGQINLDLNSGEKNNLILSNGNLILGTTTYSDNLAVNKLVTSGSAKFQNLNNAVDGDYSTYTSGTFSSSDSIIQLAIDLGSDQDFNNINLHWFNADNENSLLKKYSIEVSSDNSNWRNAVPLSENSLIEEKMTFEKLNARYVRIYLYCGIYGSDETFGLREIKVFNYENEGKYEFVADAEYPVKWEQLEWAGSMPQNTKIVFRTRTGNTPDPINNWEDHGGWNDWSEEYASSPTLINSANERQYIQIQARLISASPDATPSLSNIILTNKDNTPPAISVLSPQSDEIFYNKNIKIYVSADELVIFKFILNKNDINFPNVFLKAVNGALPASSSLIKNGQNTLTIFATDKGGNEVQKSIIFNVDLVLPEITILSPEKKTYLTKTVKIAATSNKKIIQWKYSLNGGNFASFNPLSQLQITGKKGQNTLTISAADFEDIEVSKTITFNIDATAPEITINSPQEGHVFNSKTITFDMTTNEDDAYISWKYSLDNGNTNITFIPKVSIYDMPEGQNKLTVYAMDQAENENSKTVSFVVDITAPMLTEITPIATLTNDNTPDYVFNSNEAGSITYANGCTSGAASAVVGTNKITFNTLADGTYNTCAITVTDTAGNPSNILAVTPFIIDTTAPAVNILSPLTGQKVNGDAVILFTSDSSNPQCSIDDLNWAACVSGATKLKDLAGFASLPDGAFILHLKDTDAAGNTGTDKEENIVKDTTAPIIIIIKPDKVYYLSNSLETNISINEAGTCEISIGINKYIMGKNVNYYNYTLNPLTEGRQTVKFICADEAGNINENELTFYVNLNAVEKDIDGDGKNETANNTDSNPANGYEEYSDPDASSALIDKIIIDGQTNFLIDTNNDTLADIYWDIDSDFITDVSELLLNGETIWVIDTNNDGKPDIYYNSTDNTTYDYTYPVINIISPEEKIYSTSSVSFEYSIYGNYSSCDFSLDGQTEPSCVNTTKTLENRKHEFRITVNDTNGNIISRKVDFSVSYTPSANPQPPANTGGSGGSGGVPGPKFTPNPKIEFIAPPENIDISGTEKTFLVTVQNKGNVKLFDIKLKIEGLPESWYIATPDKKDLDIDSTANFNVKMVVPEDFKEQKNFTIKVSSKEKLLSSFNGMLKPKEAVEASETKKEEKKQCNDGIDNDNDGLIDYLGDPGCSDWTDTDENDIKKAEASNPVTGLFTFVYKNPFTTAGAAAIAAILGSVGWSIKKDFHKKKRIAKAKEAEKKTEVERQPKAVSPLEEKKDVS